MPAKPSTQGSWEGWRGRKCRLRPHRSAVAIAHPRLGLSNAVIYIVTDAVAILIGCTIAYSRASVCPRIRPHCRRCHRCRGPLSPMASNCVPLQSQSPWSATHTPKASAWFPLQSQSPWECQTTAFQNRTRSSANATASSVAHEPSSTWPLRRSCTHADRCTVHCRGLDSLIEGSRQNGGPD